jgi:RNase adaptor protein for sRNA GlmZ degradation
MKVEYPELGWEPTYTMLGQSRRKEWKGLRDEVWKRCGAIREERQRFIDRDGRSQRDLAKTVGKKLLLAEESARFLPTLELVSFGFNYGADSYLISEEFRSLPSVLEP